MADREVEPFHDWQAVEFVRPGVPRKGRGAVSNMQGRYEVNQRAACDDGWGGLDGAGAGEAQSLSLPTQVTDEVAKSILSRNTSPDIPFNVSLNPYRGCEQGM